MTVGVMCGGVAWNAAYVARLEHLSEEQDELGYKATTLLVDSGGDAWVIEHRSLGVLFDFVVGRSIFLEGSVRRTGLDREGRLVTL